MSRRPFALTRQQRPLSAIFIGSLDSNTSSLPTPDLPEPPPSPSVSIGSGLPSPPATNSTGSGSVGDDSPNGRSVRKQKPIVLSTTSNSSPSAALTSSTFKRPESRSDMSRGATYGKTQQQHPQQQQSSSGDGGRGRTSYADDDEDDPNNENDEDHTARLSLDRRRSAKTTLPPDDNVSALARVKNLTQRNRMVLDKLTSISRLSSPVPSKSRSPFPLAKPTSPTASSSASSSRHSSASHSRPMHTYATITEPSASSTSNFHDPPSGSETEREPSGSTHSLHSYSSSDSLSVTPTSTFSEIRTTDFVRPRQISAPASPQRNRNNRERDRDRAGSPGPSSRNAKKRESMPMSVDERRYDYEDDGNAEDVTTAALAAVASSRRNPSNSNRRTRNPLPREFRDKDRRSMDGKSEPSTPHRNRDAEREFQRERQSPSSPRALSTNHSQRSPQSSPRRPGQARYSTVRELTRKHQTRWLSEDLSASHADRDDDDSAANRSFAYGRKQSSKPGSSESPISLIGGGRLLGEGLRAAGLTKRKDGPEDVFVSPSRNGSMAPPAVIPRRTRSTGSGSILSGDRESPTPGTSSGRGEGVGPPASSQRTMDLRTPAPRQSDRSVTYALQGRPGTSMAALHGDSPNMPPPRTAPPNTVTFRTSLREDQMTSQLPEDLHRNDQARTEVSLPPPRAYTSPFAPPRALSTTFSPPPTSGNANDPFFEHRRLMLESLSIFESHLSRIPPMGQMTTTTIPEVFQSSQHLIHTMDKLNSMLKVATNRALESQIEAEVSDQGGEVNMSEIWTKVGMEHRDNLRLSDEVVRTMTGFLLGVGKILREATNASSQQQHLRTLSLDDDVGSRRGTPEVNLNSLPVDRRSSDGRKSRETRRSWDPREAVNLTALTSTSKAGLLGRERTGLTSRPASSMDIVRTSTASSSEGRSVQGVEGTPQPARNIASTLVGSLRRPYTPRELRLGAVEGPASDPVVRKSLASYNSHDTLQEYEPSPTPAARLNGGRILVPLSIPPSLPTLPSETTLRRNGTISASNSSSSHPTPSSSNGGSSDNALSSRRKVSTNSNITVRGESSTSSFQPILKPASVTTAVTPHTVSVSISPESQLQNLPPTRNEARHTSTNTVTFSRSATTLAGIRQQQRQEEQERRMRTISTSGLPSEEEPSPVSATNLRSPMSGSETERPRTFAFRGRFSLDGAKGEDRDRIGLGSQATTLITTRRERRKTMTENFWQR